MNNILSHYESIQKLRSGMSVQPRFVDFHTSNSCNMRCNGCAYNEMLDDDVMSEAHHAQIIKELLEVGVKGFDFAGGGEPLMLGYIMRIWRMIIAGGGHYGVITNGTLLDDSLIKEIIDTATYIRISLEATSPEEYSIYKNVPKIYWYNVCDNIKKLWDRKKKTGSKCDISVKFGVGESLQGYKHYMKGIQFGRECDVKIDRIVFSALRHEPEELPKRMLVSQHAILQNALIECRKIGLGGNVYEKLLPTDIGNVPQCWLNPLHTVIDHKGNVYICCYYYYRGDEHLIGNIIEKPFKSFWMNDRHLELIRKIDPRECAKVNCKFFRHHEIVKEAFTKGRIEFL